MLVFNPAAPGRSMPHQPGHVFPSLPGKIVGFIDNSKPNFKLLADEIAEGLKNKYGVHSTLMHSKRGPSIPAAQSVIDDLARRCDLVIAGSGN